MVFLIPFVKVLCDNAIRVFRVVSQRRLSRISLNWLTSPQSSKRWRKAVNHGYSDLKSSTIATMFEGLMVPWWRRTWPTPGWALPASAYNLNTLLVEWPSSVALLYAKVCLEVVQHFLEDVSIFSSDVDIPEVIGDPQRFHDFFVINRFGQLAKYVDLS